jgi:hypothetical protein
MLASFFRKESMPIVISAAASIFAYLILMQLMFEDLGEFRKKLRTTIEWFPVSFVLDYVSGNDSIRVWIWMISGPIIGVLVYSSIPH